MPPNRNRNTNAYQALAPPEDPDPSAMTDTQPSTPTRSNNIPAPDTPDILQIGQPQLSQAATRPTKTFQPKPTPLFSSTSATTQQVEEATNFLGLMIREDLVDTVRQLLSDATSHITAAFTQEISTLRKELGEIRKENELLKALPEELKQLK